MICEAPLLEEELYPGVTVQFQQDVAATGASLHAFYPRCTLSLEELALVFEAACEVAREIPGHGDEAIKDSESSEEE